MNIITDWSIMRSFLAVAKTGSYSAAAKLLGLSQPSIGRHIQALESYLETELFARHARGYALTQKGRDILPYAQEMQHAMARIETIGPAPVEQGSVRITASDYICHTIMPNIIAAIREAHPEISIDLIPSDASANLLFREADIAVRMYQPKQLEIITRKIGNLQLAAVASKMYVSKNGRPQSPTDFAQHSLIGYDRSDLIIKAMQAGGIPATRDWFQVRCDNQGIYWDLVRAGCGIGFGQLAVAQQDPALDIIFDDLGIAPLPVWLACHENIFKSPRIKTVWAHIAEGFGPFVS